MTRVDVEYMNNSSIKDDFKHFLAIDLIYFKFLQKINFVKNKSYCLHLRRLETNNTSNELISYKSGLDFRTMIDMERGGYVCEIKIFVYVFCFLLRRALRWLHPMLYKSEVYIWRIVNVQIIKYIES